MLGLEQALRTRAHAHVREAVRVEHDLHPAQAAAAARPARAVGAALERGDLVQI